MLKSFIVISAIGATGIIGLNFDENNNQQQSVINSDPETNFKTYCAGCHGEKMEAFTDRQWKHGRTAEDIFKSIKFGYKDGGMPGFDSAFTDDEIKELAAYIVKGIDNVKRYEFQKTPVTSSRFESSAGTIRLDTVASGLKVPWSMAFLPNGEILTTERSGKLYRVTKNRSLQNITGVPEVVAEGQGGLMDIALHPDFAKNKWIYLSYSIGKKTADGVLATTAVMRAKLEGNELKEQKVLFEALPYSTTRHHYGSRLVFAKDGTLYISVGDRGNHDENPQSLERFPGKVHRIKDDGSIPSDNPFVGKPGAVGSAFTYGHRNIQGMTLNPVTGELWSNEHGPRGGDEINREQKAKNYGWPLVTYGLNYDGTVLSKDTVKAGMEQPLLYWIPSIAPSGMTFITGNKYKGWENQLLVGSLRFKYLNLCKLNGNKIVSEEILFKNIGRVRDVKMAPDGFIYMSVEDPGIIYRLVPEGK